MKFSEELILKGKFNMQLFITNNETSLKCSLNNYRLNKAIQYGINLTNQEATSNAQKIQKFVVLPTDFSVPGGELGPTLKVKRHFVLKKYESLIRNMYNVQTL